MAATPDPEPTLSWCLLAFVCAFTLLASAVRATPLEFSLHRVGGEVEGPNVLVIGGIQGDEPGGFNAASLLATHYKLRRGTLWVVPNLDFESIVRRTRRWEGLPARSARASTPC